MEFRSALCDHFVTSDIQYPTKLSAGNEFISCVQKFIGYFTLKLRRVWSTSQIEWCGGGLIESRLSLSVFLCVNVVYNSIHTIFACQAVIHASSSSLSERGDSLYKALRRLRYRGIYTINLEIFPFNRRAETQLSQVALFTIFLSHGSQPTCCGRSSGSSKPRVMRSSISIISGFPQRASKPL